jgi:hypothetical protein
MARRGRPPTGVAAKTGAQRAWEYRQRAKTRRADEAIETNRLVRKLHVDVREAEQRQATHLETKLREAERRRCEAESEAAGLRVENQKLLAANRRLKNENTKLKDEERAEIIAQALGGRGRKSRLPTNIGAKLVKALGMLGSEYQGERDNAAQLIERLRRESGLIWGDIIS